LCASAYLPWRASASPRDYTWQLGKEGTPHGIAALVQVHETYAGGGTEVLWADDDLYVMRRLGADRQPGLVFVLNNPGDRWNGAWVTTQWRNIRCAPVAWWSGSDRNRPADQWTQEDGRGQFWAPPRGYVVYAPQL